jgi:hypothetical protein
MTMSLAELRAQPHLSVSRIKTVLQCPKKFALQYIERSVPAFRPAVLAFGSAWHETIGHHLLYSTAEKPLPREALHQLFRDCFQAEVTRDGPPVLFADDEGDVGASVELGIRMLNVFLAEVPLPETVIGVEVPFSLELVDAETGEIAHAPLIGGIDAIIAEEGRPSIWELKTAARLWAADTIAYDLQMTAYAMAAREMGHANPDLKLVVMTKTTTPRVQIEHLVRHRSDEDEFVDTAFSVMNAIRAGVDYRVRGWPCRTCPFAGACGA